ncbi:TniB protein [Enterobacter hormaechei]|nr:TniB protein [Enterobacter hormaechei]
MLVIDELHNVLAGNSVNRREFLNLLRFLGNELRIPLVGVGTRDAYLAIRSDDQLEKPLRADDAAGVGGQRRLLLTAGQLRGFAPAAATLVDCHAGYGPLLLTRSEGTIGELAHLLMAAAVAAVESGEEANQPSHAQHGRLQPVPASGGGNSSGN